MEEIIKRFLSYGNGNGNGNGDGDGDGYGNGDGDGYGDGNGNGNGYGYGDGDGNGNGYGYGYGYGNRYIQFFKGYPVTFIDSVPTLLKRVELDDDLNGVAIGWILNSDFTTTRTYVVKRDGMFAHGNTLDEAVQAVQEKVLESKPVEERINAFIEAFPLEDSFVSARKLFDWHHILTGSCLQGRQAFCRDKGIDMDAEYTIAQFIVLTENAYGGAVIRALRERYKALQQQGGKRRKR